MESTNTRPLTIGALMLGLIAFLCFTAYMTQLGLSHDESRHKALIEAQAETIELQETEIAELKSRLMELER